jgi:TPR repeat protein
MTPVQASLNDLALRAESGDPEAQYSLGVHYLLGERLQQDLDASYQWLARAACGEHPAAQSLVGSLAPNAFLLPSRGRATWTSIRANWASIYDRLIRRLRRVARLTSRPDGRVLSSAPSWDKMRFKIRFQR